MADSPRKHIDRMIQALVDANTDAEIQAALEDIFEFWDKDGYAEETTSAENSAHEIGWGMFTNGKPKQAIRAKMLETLGVKPAGSSSSSSSSSDEDPGKLEGGRGKKSRKSKTSRKTRKSRKTKRRTTRRV